MSKTKNAVTSVEQLIDDMWQITSIKNDPIQIGLARDVTNLFTKQAALNWALMKGRQRLTHTQQFSPEAYGADFSIPSVAPTSADTFCGDRIMAEIVSKYEKMVADPVTFRSLIGELEREDFSEAGGAQYGSTLAHVTIGHIPKNIKELVHGGNKDSFFLYVFTRSGHVGEIELENGDRKYGVTSEASFYGERNACGAVIGTIKGFNLDNPDHVRIRQVLGEDAYDYISKHGIRTEEGYDITSAVAAGIVALETANETIRGLEKEMDPRDVGHVQAQLYVHQMEHDDLGILLGRATVHNGITRYQGFGIDPSKFGGSLVPYKHGQKRLQLTYDGKSEFPIEERKYTIEQVKNH